MTGGFVPLVEPLGETAEPAEAQQLDQYSFLAADPAMVVRSKGARTELRRLGENWTGTAAEALSVAHGLLPPQPVAPVPGLPPFQGGIAGYIGYDWGAVLEKLPAARYDDL